MGTKRFFQSLDLRLMGLELGIHIPTLKYTTGNPCFERYLLDPETQIIIDVF